MQQLRGHSSLSGVTSTLHTHTRTHTPWASRSGKTHFIVFTGIVNTRYPASIYSMSKWHIDFVVETLGQKCWRILKVGELARVCCVWRGSAPVRNYRYNLIHNTVLWPCNGPHNPESVIRPAIIPMPGPCTSYYMQIAALFSEQWMRPPPLKNGTPSSPT